ncbi:MAG TPA: hypothetical protein VFE88_03265 [Candidatus Nanoarchaeia archaeon]|nr:hypothetical protein [Candidatus Nanoarchaeia archaeon]
MNLRQKGLEQTRQQLKTSFTRDILIIQTIRTIDELITIINTLLENLRERYGYYAPRIAKQEDTETLLSAVKTKQQDDLGVSFTEEDLLSIQHLATAIEGLTNLEQHQEAYLERLMKGVCPKLQEAATCTIGARLLSRAGSLRHLAELPSSTIQVLGAERALFRHLKTGAKAPKFGVIFSHPSLTEAQEKGKTARKLAGKIALAARQDYYGHH